MTHEHEQSDRFEITRRNRVVRRPQRGFYDKKTVYPILDAAMICHLAYVIEGQPYCTPTSFWREGDTLYWHGSSASRMLRAQAGLMPVCLTVTHFDAIVLARSGFNHSINYRCVMAYGYARAVTDHTQKRQAMDHFIDRFFPDRSKSLRPPTPQEIDATTFVRMDIDSASAKVRDLHVSDDESDYSAPVWAARLPIRQVLGEAELCPRQLPTIEQPSQMAGFVVGRRLEEVLTDSYRAYESK